LLDRLCHHAHIITTTGDSYRLTHRTTGGEPTA
jgi:DNA replication protein DnaC